MQAGPPASNDARLWFEIASLRLSGFQSSANGYRTVDSASRPGPQPLAELVIEAATIWSDTADLGAAGKACEKIEGPEALRALAALHKIEATCEGRSVATLHAGDMPAIMVSGASRGRLLVARQGRVFIGRADGVCYEIPLEELLAEDIGTLFTLRSQLVLNLASESAPMAAPVLENPVRDVLGFMLTRQRRLLVQLVVAAIISNLTLLALPVYTGLVFDRVIPHGAFDTLWAVSIGVLFALCADLFVRWVRLKLQDALASAASAALQASIIRRLVSTRMADAPRSAGAVSMKLREIDGMTQLIPQAITGIGVDAPFMLIVFALIWMNGGAVVLAPMAGVILLVATHLLAHRKATEDQANSTSLLRLQTNQLIETVEGLETVKTTRSERRVLGRFERIYDEYAFSAHVVRLWQGVASYSSITIGQVMVVAVTIIGVYQISDGAMTIGGLMACTLLVGRVIAPIGQLVGVIHRLHETRATLAGLAHGGGGEVESAGDRSGVLAAPTRGEIRLVNLTFAYPGRNVPQLQDVSLSIRPGERVALIGRSGSGKSTLLRLLTRLLDPTQGAILVDDFDVRQYDPGDLRRTLGYMGQSQSLVDDTLIANLLLGVSPVAPPRFEAIARLTGVADFVAQHPEGYAMRVGLRGERLSGGERQAVALTRLLLAEPTVLLLDEPTAAMDTIAETRLVREMKAHLAGRTLVVATHRAAMLELADRLIWLEGGRIAADGPKAEVMARLAGASASNR